AARDRTDRSSLIRPPEIAQGVRCQQLVLLVRGQEAGLPHHLPDRPLTQWIGIVTADQNAVFPQSIYKKPERRRLEHHRVDEEPVQIVRRGMLRATTHDVTPPVPGVL